MKKYISTILLVLIFLCGLGLLLYPTLSDFVNQANQSKAIETYENSVANLSKDDYKRIIEDARKYNEKIISNEFPKDEKDLAGNNDYNNALNLNNDGLMGYIKIDKIKVKLAIYHTVEEPVLQIGVGHMPMTSLPVGGESTHAVLTGHRGLPSAKLFSDLDELEINDVFYVYVLDEILAYKIDKISVVEPTDTKELQIINGEDHVTLVTCTPYGVNTHRLLIRGVRVPYESTIADMSNVSNDALIINPEQVAAFIAAPILVIILAVILYKSRKAITIEKLRESEESK